MLPYKYSNMTQSLNNASRWSFVAGPPYAVSSSFLFDAHLKTGPEALPVFQTQGLPGGKHLAYGRDQQPQNQTVNP